MLELCWTFSTCSCVHSWVCVFVLNALSHPSTLICTRLCLYLCASMENVKIVESTTVSYSTTIYVRSCGYLIFIFVEFCSYNKMFREHAVTAAVAIAISIIFFQLFPLVSFPFLLILFFFFIRCNSVTYILNFNSYAVYKV